MVPMYIRPEYVEKFRCDGTMCGSCCCRDWKVAVDPETYGRYCALQPESLRDEICGWISGQDDKGNHHVRLREDGRCPFLGEDGLCRLQKEYGEDYLSDICYSYPRVSYRVGDIVEQSLAMSCPVAAGLLLGGEGPLRFVGGRMEEGRPGWLLDMSGKVGRYEEDWQELQSAGIWLLQDRRFSLDWRLFSLLCFFERAESHLTEGREEAFRRLLEEVQSGEFSVQTAACGVGFQREEYIRIMMGAFHALYGAPANEERRRALASIHAAHYPVFAESLLHGRRHLFENYLANEFFLRLYPYACSASLGENARLFVLSWKVTEFALLMLSAQETMDFERILLGIGRMTERLDHNRSGMQAIRGCLGDFFRGGTAEEFAGKLLSL